MKNNKKRTRRILRRVIQYGMFYGIANGFLWGFLQVASSSYNRLHAEPIVPVAVSSTSEGMLTVSVLTKSVSPPEPIWEQSESCWIPDQAAVLWQMIWKQLVRHDL